MAISIALACDCFPVYSHVLIGNNFTGLFFYRPGLIKIKRREQDAQQRRINNL